MKEIKVFEHEYLKYPFDRAIYDAYWSKQPCYFMFNGIKCIIHPNSKEEISEKKYNKFEYMYHEAMGDNVKEINF